jgi:signal transduction histidine kinase
MRASVVTFDFAAHTVTTLASYTHGLTELAGPVAYPLDPQRIAEDLRRGELHIVEDTTTLARPPAIMQALQIAGLRSYMSVALISDADLIGVLTVGSDQLGRFAPEQIEIAREIANQLAVAIKNSWLHSSEQRARRTTETFHRANLALTRTLELDVVLETLLDFLAQLVPYDSANVMLLEADARLVVRSMRGYERWTDPEQTRALVFNVDDTPVMQQLLTSQASMLISDTRTYPGWERPLGTEHVLSWMGVPLNAGGALIGIYSMDKAEPGFFTPDHVQLAESLAAQAAVAIQNARLFAEVQAGREHLQQLSRRLVEVQEAERRHLARELHDEIGQTLTGLSLALTIGARATFDSLRTRMAEAQRQVNDLTAQIRSLSLDLRPSMLDDLGLLPALLWYFRRYTAQTQVQVTFKHTAVEQRFAANIEITAYRVIQEALTNVARHAGVDMVIVRLWANEQLLGIQIEDRGRGFDAMAALAPYRSNGLTGMRERVLLIGGYFTIDSAPEAGARLTAELPLADRFER